VNLNRQLVEQVRDNFPLEQISGRACLAGVIRSLREMRKKKLLLASSCLYVCPYVHMEQLGSHWTEFHEILYLSIFFENLWEDKKVSLQSDKYNRYFT